MSDILKYFAYEHLPVYLQEVSKPIGELAILMDKTLPNCAEKSAGLRKLLEAKDCLVRARLEKYEEMKNSLIAQNGSGRDVGDKM